MQYDIIKSLRKIILLALIYVFFASFAFSEEIEKDDIFLIDDAPFDVHKSKIEEIKKSKT